MCRNWGTACPDRTKMNGNVSCKLSLHWARTRLVKPIKTSRHSISRRCDRLKTTKSSENDRSNEKCTDHEENVHAEISTWTEGEASMKVNHRHHGQCSHAIDFVRVGLRRGQYISIYACSTQGKMKLFQCASSYLTSSHRWGPKIRRSISSNCTSKHWDHLTSSGRSATKQTTITDSLFRLSSFIWMNHERKTPEIEQNRRLKAWMAHNPLLITR